MSLIRAAIDNAIAEVLAEHPKYFTPKGAEKARTVLVRKIMHALSDRGTDEAEAEPPPLAGAKYHRVMLESREGRGYANLRLLAGAVAPRSITGDGRLLIEAPANCEAVYALADLPPKDRWLFLTDKGRIAAWGKFFREMLPEIARRSIVEARNGEVGILMPYPWAPSKSGKIYNEDSVA